MEYKDIKKLMDDMGSSNLDSLEIDFPEGIKISMKKSEKKEVTLDPHFIETNTKMTVSTIKSEENKMTRGEKNEDLNIIKSPMVGTFYTSSAPDKEPFIKVGDKIHKGQVVCIVEAMKLMNEIESEYDGEVVEICMKNEDIAEYGSELIKIRS